MPQPISQTFRDEKNKQENAPIFLYEIEVDGATTLYYAEYDIPVVFGSPPHTYTPFPLGHEAISSNIQGEIDAVKVKLSNVSREIGAAIIQNNGLRGKKVTVKLVFADHLDDPTAYISDTFYIDGSVITEGMAEFTLTSGLDLYDINIPGRIFERDYCQWEFKKEGCWLWSGSAWTAPSGFLHSDVQCDKTRKGIAGCSYHVNSLRFGGFPSIPTRGLFFV